MHDEAHRTAEMMARRSYGKLVAFLAARTRDVSAAEDALSEAFASALSDWPQHGCPANPEAWLLTVARRKAVDHQRSQQRLEYNSDALDNLIAGLEASTGNIPDERLALVFTCAHPAIETAARTPLILQVVLGLDAKAIASAFLVSPAAMGKRLVRAKEKIRQAGIPFRVPERKDLPERLEVVFEAVYAAFSEGWSDPEGTDVVRRDLVEEAIFLARLLVELLPDEPEALGLLACMLHAEARRKARRNQQGEYVPFSEQDTNLWDKPMILEAEILLRRASAAQTPSRFQIEAALQSAHVYRRSTGKSNWKEVVVLYDLLLSLTHSPVVAINRARAVCELDGAKAALDAMPDHTKDKQLVSYQPYWAARAHLLAKLGRQSEVSQAYGMAIGLERDPAIRCFLERRRRTLISDEEPIQDKRT